MKVAVVILNWNGRHFIQKFLPSVIKNSPSAEIIIADNASSDDSVEFIRKEFPGVTLIENNSNLGFAGGYNEALKKIKASPTPPKEGLSNAHAFGGNEGEVIPPLGGGGAEYYVLLNSDVEVTERWIEPVIELMEADKTIAACQPKLLNYYKRDYFEFAGAAGGFIDRLGYPFCRGRLFQSIEKDNGQYNDKRKIFWATGACMFVRAKAFHEVNGFDELFFAHMEEIDLCWRLQLSGHQIYYSPDSTIYHVGGGTLPKSNSHKTYLNFRNNWMMLYKNLSDKEFDKIKGTRLLLDWIAALKFMLSSGGLKEMNAVFRAHRDFKKLMPEIKRSGNSAKNGQLSDVIFPESILAAYYLKGKKNFDQLNF